MKIKVGRKTVVFEERSHDWVAYIQGDPGYWDRGRVPFEALGYLIQAHPEEFKC